MYDQTLTNLRLTRLRTGIPQYVVAKRAQLAPSRLSVLERGYDEPTDRERMALAGVLGADADDLFPRAAAGGSADAAPTAPEPE
jgi:transcriptional regulator with XRE-family HTH domain